MIFKKDCDYYCDYLLLLIILIDDYYCDYLLLFMIIIDDYYWWLLLMIIIVIIEKDCDKINLVLI